MKDNNLQYFIFHSMSENKALRKALQGKNLQLKEICLSWSQLASLTRRGFSSLGF